MKNLKIYKIVVILFNILILANCGGGGTVSTQTVGEDFAQVSNADVKIDILWVIDDSGSMAPGQSALTTNINSFINLFYQKGFDFRVAVAKTSNYSGSSLFNGGVLASSSLNQTQMESQFASNANVGVSGTGDERGLQSMEAVLNNTNNQPFPRPGAHLAVIFLADEDDCTSCSSKPTVSSYHNYLMTLTGSTSGDLLFSAHAIVVDSSTCKSSGYYGNDGINHIHGAASIGTRYNAMADYSNGLKISICSAFGPSLANLADNLASKASQFYLQHEPIVSTISITISGVNGDNPIPQSTTNGWDYSASNQSIRFYGSMIPPQGANISVSYVTKYLIP